MKLFLLFAVIFVTIVVIKTETVYDVTKYGADNKGAKKSTDAIKKAIDAAVAKGGGTVLFPDGQYLTGPINLKSHITLHLADKAVVKFSTDKGDYPPLKLKLSDGEQDTKFTPLIYAYKETNIGITGKGVLDGQGSAWWKKKSMMSLNGTVNYKLEAKQDVVTPYELNFLKPPFIHLFECKNIVLNGITVKNSPFWNVNPVFSDNIQITGITIDNPTTATNTDGINCYSCRNLVISKVTINTGDDCVAIDAGILNGAKHPAENIHISDSHMGKGHAGVAIGSAVSAGVRNLTVNNCVFDGTDRGLYVKTNRERGGTVEGLKFNSVTMNGITHEGLVLSMVYKASGQNAALHDIKNIPKQAVTAKTPVIRNIEFTDIKGSAKTSIFFVGVPESPIQNIKMTKVDIKTKEPMSFTNTKNVELNGKKQS